MKGTFREGKPPETPGVNASGMVGSKLYRGSDGGIFFCPYDNRPGNKEPIVLRLCESSEPPFIIGDPNAYGPYTPLPAGSTFTLEV